MKEEFVLFEQAKLLKELGFPQREDLFYGKFKDSSNIDDWKIEPVTDSYEYPIYKTCSEYYNCPRLSIVQKWLREEKGIYVDVQTTYLGSCGYAFDYLITKEDKEVLEDDHPCFTYEDALSLGIDVALKLDFDNIPDGYIVIKTPIE